MDTFHIALGLYPHTRALHGEAVPFDASTQLLAEPLSNAGGFGHLLEDNHFDIFEFPVVSLAVARQQGIPIVGTSIVVTRHFHRSRLVWNPTGLTGPADLAHRRAGLRYHGFTDAASARRGILSDDYGLNSNDVTWITATPETVPSAPLPENVRFEPDVAAEERLTTGDLAMLILNPGQHLQAPNIEAMFPDLIAAEDDWFRRTGVLPINHVIAVRERAIEEHPNLVEQLSDVFTHAKATGLRSLTKVVEATPEERNLMRSQGLLGADPLPYGIEENRVTLEMLLRFAAEQRVLLAPVDLASVFVG